MKLNREEIVLLEYMVNKLLSASRGGEFWLELLVSPVGTAFGVASSQDFMAAVPKALRDTTYPSRNDSVILPRAPSNRDEGW